MITGVWLLGGLFMMLNATFSGGGFRSQEGIRWAVQSLVLSLIPLYTWMLATYDGSLMALVTITLGGCIVSVFHSKWR
jgi:hypothetical protein